MNAERLLAHYERIADAFDAIPRLRRFVLDLAVRGKLVPQDPNDEPVSELLKRIAAEKARLVKAGEIKKEKTVAPVDDEVDFEIPATWRWTRLGATSSYIQRGKSPKYAASDGSPVVSQKCVQWAGLDLSVAKQVTLKSLDEYEEVRFLRDGDLLWNSTGTGTIGRVIRVVDPPQKLVCDSHVTVVRCLEVDPEYVRTWLRSDHVYALIEDRAAGSTNQVELTSQMATNQVVPLPPLAEQRRIVAKVDELMALCDRLDAARGAREATRDRLAAASLARLNTPEPETFRDDARFALDALPALAARPDQIKHLRQTILNLAVLGKLVPQDPKDEPVANLLNELARLKKQLLAEKKIRNQKVSDSPSPDEFPFSIPDEWRWARLGQAVTLLGGFAYESDAYVSESSNQIIRLGNVKNDALLLDQKPALIPDTLAQQTADYAILEGDILITMTGTKAKRDYAFTLAVKFTDLAKHRLFLNQRVGAIRPFQHELVPLINTFLKSDRLLDLIFATATGTANQANIGTSSILDLPFPLPPLTEQHRIVAKVDELMGLCDRLEASLSIADDTRCRLLDALLAEALATTDALQREAAE